MDFYLNLDFNEKTLLNTDRLLAPSVGEFHSKITSPSIEKNDKAYLNAYVLTFDFGSCQKRQRIYSTQGGRMLLRAL